MAKPTDAIERLRTLSKVLNPQGRWATSRTTDRFTAAKRAGGSFRAVRKER